MASNVSDNIRTAAPKPLDDKWGVFEAFPIGWRPFNNIAEFNSIIPLASRFNSQTFWVKSETNADKADLYTLDKNKTPYKVQADVDLTNYYTKAQIDAFNLSLSNEIAVWAEVSMELNEDLIDLTGNVQQEVIDRQTAVQNEGIARLEGDTNNANQITQTNQLLNTEINRATTEENSIRALVVGKANTSDIVSTIPIVYSDLTAGKDGYQNVLYANRTLTLLDYTTGAVAAYTLVFNSSGLASLGFVASSDFKGTLLGESLSEIINIYPELYPSELIVCDTNGYIATRTNSSGFDYPDKISMSVIADLQSQIDAIANSPVLAEFYDLYGSEFILSDPNGNVGLRFNSTGLDYIGKTSGGSGTVIPIGTYRSDYIHHLTIGQSLSVNGTNAISNNFYDSKTFTGGVLTNYDPSNTTARDAYYGSNFANVPATGNLSPKPIAKMVKELIFSENQIPYADQNYTQIINSCGDGGISYATIANESGIYFIRLMESIDKAIQYSVSAGKSFSVGTISYIQGENSSDRSKSESTWFNDLDTLFTRMNTLIKAKTGQPNDVQFVFYQIATGMSNGLGLPMGFLRLAREKANYHLGTVMYQLPYIPADAFHLTSAGYWTMWANIGVVVKRVTVDNIKAKFIDIDNWYVTKNPVASEWIINMAMKVPVAPLVFDETYKIYDTPPVNKGFSILVGATEIITDVVLERGTNLTIKCNQNPTGQLLTYAKGGKDSGGYLRDSQGETIKINGERLDNWCPIFSQVI